MNAEDRPNTPHETPETPGRIGRQGIASAIRGELERGAAARITGLPERSARRVLTETIAERLLGSDSPKGPVSLRFPPATLETLFPRLF
jgi:hypothetical protein